MDMFEIVQERLELEKAQKAEEEKKEPRKFKIVGTVLVCIMLAIFALAIYLHFRALLIINLLISFFTAIRGVIRLLDGHRRWGVVLLVITFIMVSGSIFLYMFRDNVSVLYVCNGKSEWRYYTANNTTHYVTARGEDVMLKRGETYIENNSMDTLVIYSVNYSEYAISSYNKYDKQVILPMSFEILEYIPDYYFCSPPETLRAKKKTGEISHEVKYVLDKKNSKNK